MRLCNDFRKLNQVSEFDSYNFPRVDDLVERLGRARFISTLDLTKGYWQVAQAPEARPKTAFSTANGHWQYRVLSFGAPQSARNVPAVNGHCPAPTSSLRSCLPTWSDHLFHLGEVLKELRKVGLTANPKRMHWKKN
ncbi:uncharacterized protein LOC108260857 isoform X2 [Ictalurus punctatus]|uniref:ribonuclease H n=1 Tax=Ictalurus punctatus TaxID=7998 RepID=A0A9F7RDJ0_ICTPU|nr:uncharacterized protein LOC108260857 isoform X2 [Ictalurus punctatus]